MGLPVTEKPPETQDIDGLVRVGRQGIFDSSGRRLGHELLFRGLAQGSITETAQLSGNADDQATSHVIAATFGDFGVTELSGGLPLYINMTRAFLVGELPMPFGPEGVVLEILENIPVDDELLESVGRLRARGYRLALDDYVGEDERRALLPLVDIVKLDLLSPGIDVATLMEKLQHEAPQATILAERVEDEETVNACMALGIEVFQGYFFERPAVLETRRITPSQVMCLRLLKLLTDEDVSFEQLEDVVVLDPGLSLRVLRTANSAMHAGQRRITSLRQAMTLMGSRSLGSWVVLTLIGGAGPGRQEELVEILTRAGLCEDLGRTLGADTATCYTAGMISAVARTLQIPLHQMATTDLVGEELSCALLRGEGLVGSIVAAATDLDLGHPDPGAHLGISPLEISQRQLAAWAWARRTLDQMLG